MTSRRSPRRGWRSGPRRGPAASSLITLRPSPRSSHSTGPGVILVGDRGAGSVMLSRPAALAAALLQTAAA